jgi:transmembrane sensor
MTEQTESVTGSAEVEAHAAAWLERKSFASWMATDQAELDVWLATSWAHRVAYWRLETAWSRTERLTALRAPSVQSAEPVIHKRLPRFLKAIGALAFVGMVGVSAFAYFSQPKDSRYETATGEHKVLQLADGSRIELNTETVLRVSHSLNNRTAWLERGEAYFEVKHNVVHPFIVLVGDHRITDLGTEFSVRRNENQTKITLVKGRARIDPQTGTHTPSAVLVPGDVVVATMNSLQVVKKPQQELLNELGWRRGMLVFANTTLADVAAEFNRYNRTKMLIADPAAARRRIGATFPAQDVEDFAVLARTVLRLHVEKQGNTIVISR